MLYSKNKETKTTKHCMKQHLKIQHNIQLTKVKQKNAYCMILYNIQK